MREFEAVKRFIHGELADDLGGGNIDHSDFVAPMAAVEHGDKAIFRMHGDIDREIAEYHLFADRPQRPLIGEQDRAIGALPGQIGRRLARGWRRMRNTSREQKQSSRREEL